MKPELTPVLVDTSVWIDHFRSFNVHISELVTKSRAWTHGAIIGELACGNLSKRALTLADLQDLPRVLQPNDAEVLHFIEANKLMGRGIGYIDMQVLASARINSVSVWTMDKHMVQAATDLKMNYVQPPVVTRPN